MLHSVPTAEWIVNLAVRSAVLLAAGRLLLLLVRRRAAPLRSGIAFAVLIVVILLPFLSLPATGWRYSSLEMRLSPGTAVSPVGEAPGMEGRALSPGEAADGSAGAGLPQAAIPASGRTAPGFSVVAVVNALGLLWGCGIACLLMRLALGIRSAGNILKTGSPAGGPRLERILAEAAESLGIPPGTRILESPLVEGPMAVGIVNPAVLLPSGLAGKLTDRDLRSVVSHELSHILHRDNLAGLIQRLAAALVWWNPLAHGLNAELSRAREEVSDNHVLRGSDSRYYAACLVNLAENVSRPGRRPVAVAMASPHLPLKDRVKTILSKERTMETQLNKRAVLAIALTACLVAGLAAGYRLTFAAGPEASEAEFREAAPAVSADVTVSQEKQSKNLKLIKKVEPVYPAEAKEAGIEGTVVLEIRIDTEGAVESVKVLKRGPEALDKAAADAVKQWLYEPLIVDGKARPVVATVTVRFTLGEKKFDVIAAEAVGAVEGEKPPIRAIGDIKGPKCIKKVQPVYPPEAREAQIQGNVILEATTDNEGRVVDVKVLRSVPELNQAAIDAVKQWVYEPMIIDGEARGIVFTVTVRFQLK